MGKTYYYDIDEYHFKLYIGYDGTRWDDEGVLQPVKLSLNGYYILNNNWGIAHNLEILLKEPFITEVEPWKVVLPTGVYDDLPDLLLYGEQRDNFMTWIKSCLSPKEDRIKIKINKILEHKKGI